MSISEKDNKLMENWEQDPEQVRLLEKRLKSARISRRNYLGIMGGLAGTAFLAACGAQATSTPAPTTAPTAAPTVGLATVASSSSTTAAATTAATTTAAAAATTTAAADLAAEQVFTTFVSTEPTSHDFNKDLYCGGETMLFAGLLKFTPDFGVAPYAAERFEVKDGGSKYVFYLNQKGKWSNGDPVTADDFVWSFTRQLDPATGAAYAGFLYDIKNAESFNTKQGATAADLGLKALDKYTLEVTLEGPRGYFPILAAYVAALPAHKASVEKFGDKWTEAANIVTNGPFKLTSWDHNKQYVIERFDDFALGTKPKLQKVITKIVPNQSGLLPYENGELDFRNGQGFPSTEVPRVKADSKLSKEFFTFSQSGLWYLDPVANKAPFDNKQVRMAVMHAIDREKLLKLINGLGQAAYSLLSPDLPGYIDPAKYPEYKELAKFDPAMAMNALKGTPFEGGKNWPKIVLSMREEGETANTVAQFVQQQLKDNIGMEVQLEVLERRVFLDKLYKNEHQFVFIRWFMDYPDPNNFYYQVYYSKFPSGKRHYYANETYDDLVTKARGETDAEKRLAMYRDAEKILLSDAAYVPLYYPFGAALLKPYVKGLPANKAGLPVPDWNIYVNMKESMYINKK